MTKRGVVGWDTTIVDDVQTGHLYRWYPIEVCWKPGSSGQGEQGWEPFATVVAGSARDACYLLGELTGWTLPPLRIERAYHRGERREERPWG